MLSIQEPLRFRGGQTDPRRTFPRYSRRAKSTRSWDPMAPANRRCPTPSPGGRATRSPAVAVTLNGDEPARPRTPASGRRRGCSCRSNTPLKSPACPALTFLRTALNAQHRARGEAEVAAPAFLKLVRAKAAELKIDFEMLKRGLNVGFLRRREETHGNHADVGAFSQAGHPRRDRFRSGHRRPAHCLRGGQRHALARPGHAGDYPLPAPARLHPAGSRPRARRRPDCRVGRPGTGVWTWSATATTATPAPHERPFPESGGSDPHRRPDRTAQPARRSLALD